MKGKENSKENNLESKNSQMDAGGANRRNNNLDRSNRMRRKPRPFKVERAANNNKVELTVPVETPEPDAKPAVKIIPLGGLEQIGMNITAFEY